MEAADSGQQRQNGLSKKIYTERNDDGTITEYHEEHYMIDGDNNVNIKHGEQPEVVLITDEADFKVYQSHEILEDGREVITTTTLSTDENGEVTEETVTEVLVSEEVEYESEAEESEEEGVLQVNGSSKLSISDQEELDDIPEEVQSDVDKISEDERFQEQQSRLAAGVEAYREETISSELLDANQGDSAKPIRRFEEYEQQFTEYKPPKRYEKKQSDSALDKIAPRITIMNEEENEGLNKNNFSQPKVPASPEKDEQLSASAEIIRAGDNVDDGLEACSGMGRKRANFEQSSAPALPTQPTRTQGNIIRRRKSSSSSHSRYGRSFQQLILSVGGYSDYWRYIKDKTYPSTLPQRWMDSETEPVDRENIIRADDQPDFEAELPAQGTSRNLRMMFQTLETDSVPSVHSDRTTPVKERPRTGMYGYNASGITSPPVNGLDSVDCTEPQFEGGEIENIPEIRTDLVREADRNDEVELPESGLAKNLLSRFKSLESENQSKKEAEHRPSGIGSKPPVTPMRPTSGEVVNSLTAELDYEAQPEGGEFENVPEVREDLIKESDRNDEEEFPTIGITRNLVSVFKEREAVAKTTPVYKPSGAAYRSPRSSSRATSETSQEAHEEPQFEGGEVENIPEVRTDLVREADRNDEEELPERGITRNIMAQYSQQMESTKRDYKEHKPSGVASKATPTPLGANRSYSRGASLTESRTSVLSDADSTDAVFEPQVEGGEFENTPVVREDLIREQDRNDEEELPEQGLARNLLSQFQNLEQETVKMRKSQYTPSGVGAKPTPTPLRPSPQLDSTVISGETIAAPPEGGYFENNPTPRLDVIHECDSIENDMLPEQGVTSNLRTQFQDLAANVEPAYTPSGIGSKSTPSKLHIMAGRSSYHAKGTTADAPANAEVVYESPQPEGGEYENEPAVRADVVKEDVRYDEEELPEQGVTRSLLTRFKSYEEQNKQTQEHRPSGVASKPTPTPLRPTSGVLADESTIRQDYQQEVTDGGEYENEPEVNTNVVRSSDSYEHEHIPTAGAAKNVMARFRELEQEAENNNKSVHKPSKIASSATPTPLTLKR